MFSPNLLDIVFINEIFAPVEEGVNFGLQKVIKSLALSLRLLHLSFRFIQVTIPILPGSLH